MRPPAEPEKVYTVAVFFAGGGLYSRGMEAAEFGWRGLRGRFEVVAAVDAWPEACRVHDLLCSGARATCLDLFSREDYEAYHGHPPPPEWREVTPEDIRALYPAGPDGLITSPPCQGFSPLISAEKAQTEKYQALCRLTVRGMWLALAAWPHKPPRLVLLENVPRIINRGEALLQELRALLRANGYTYDERIHDAGELGGLAQSRRRYLLAARRAQGTPFPVHLPAQRPLRAVGEVLSQVPCPLPGAKLPPMHAVPKGQHWLTALRLALIRPGKDWRDLQTVEAYAVAWHDGRGLWLVAAQRDGAWQRPPGWAEAEVLGVWAVDPETLGRAWSRETAYTVRGWDQTAGTIAASRGGATASGAPYVADPRLGCAPRAGAYGVIGWDETSPTVAASVDVHAGSAAVADPREVDRGLVRVGSKDEHPSRVSRGLQSSGRVVDRGRRGVPSVRRVREPASISALPKAEAPALPAPTDRGAWVILSPGGCWHRPFTTLEVALVMGLPAKVKGAPLDLYALGLSDADARQVLGNGVPPPAAQAIGEEFGQALLEADGVVPVRLALGGRWVQPTADREMS